MLKKVRRIGNELLEDTYSVLFNQPYGTILMLHRIGDKNPAYLDSIEELKVSVPYLQQYVDQLRDKSDFVSLDEAIARIKNPALRKRPFICFTFDDGFRDNLTLGHPFFEKNKIPFTVFLTAGFIDCHPGFNWPFVLERMISANDSLTIAGQTYSCATRSEKEQTFRSLKGLVQSFPYEHLEDTFRKAFTDYLTDECFEDMTLTWDEVRQLATSPLCTLGAHTMTHCRLSNVPDNWLGYELLESKRMIELEIGKEVKYLSYPFGWKTDVNERVCAVARNAGYAAALISWGGPVRKHDNDLFTIKRQMLLSND